jgi:flagellar biosynthetic protein FliR
MFTVSGAEIMSWGGTFLWPLFRIAALVSAAPIFGAHAIPMRVKLIFSLVLTLVMMPIIPPAPVVDFLSANAVLITVNQILIGVSMGLALQLLFAMFVVGGQVFAFQMGLGFASMVDPNSGTQVPVLSQFYVIMLTLLFFALDGHLVFIDIVANSFQVMPIGMNGISTDGFWALANLGGKMYSGGLQIAVPLIASLLLINITFGIITRSAPQFNIFSFGFPITIVAGFLLMWLTFDTVVPNMTHQLNEVFTFIRWLLGGGS